MAQATILAAGTTAATSTDVTVAAGSVATVGIFSASGPIVQMGPLAMVVADTPGGDNAVKVLSADEPATLVSGPGTYRVVRSPVSVAIGVYSET